MPPRKRPLRPGKGHPVRRKALAAVNSRRRAKLRKRQYGDHATWIRKHVCPICGAHPVHAHHTKGRLVESLTPLCWKHHRLYHDIGRETFRRETGVDLDALSAELWELSPANPANKEAA